MNQPTPRQIERLRTAYAAFNARDIDAALATMTADVAWPRAFKGGFVEGPRAVRAYWTEQWSEISPQVEPVAFHLEEDGRILVGVHQMVRDLAGAVLADEHVGHRFHPVAGLDPKDGGLFIPIVRPTSLTMRPGEQRLAVESALYPALDFGNLCR